MYEVYVELYSWYETIGYYHFSLLNHIKNLILYSKHENYLVPIEQGKDLCFSPIEKQTEELFYL